jgi:hypothetical protein
LNREWNEGGETVFQEGVGMTSLGAVDRSLGAVGGLVGTGASLVQRLAVSDLERLGRNIRAFEVTDAWYKDGFLTLVVWHGGSSGYSSFFALTAGHRLGVAIDGDG